MAPRPADVQNLSPRIYEASVAPSQWVGVIRVIEDRLPGATCEIIGEPHGDDPGAGIPYKITRSGLRSDIPNAFRPEDFEQGTGNHRPGDIVPVGGSAWRSGPGLLPSPAGPNGSALFLYRSATRDWFLAVRYVGNASAEETKGITTFLFRHSRILIQGFRVAHAIGTGTLPAKLDLEAAWDRLPYAVVLLSKSLRPLFANVAAEEAFSARRLFSPSGPSGRVRLRDQEADDEMESAVLRIAEEQSERETIAVSGAGEDPGLLIELIASGRCATTRAMRRDDDPLPEPLIMILRTVTADTNVTRMAKRGPLQPVPAA